jgi:hypothetical protein
MSTTPDGGPAFPTDHLPEGIWRREGMSLRDYFAAKAMAGDWAAQNEECGEWACETQKETLEARAVLYYRMADAMLKARDNQP